MANYKKLFDSYIYHLRVYQQPTPVLITGTHDIVNGIAIHLVLD